MKLPELPPVAIAVQLPPPELELLEELLLDDELELLLDEEELDEEELDEEELDELEDEELELLLELVPPTVTVKACMVCAPQLLV